MQAQNFMRVEEVAEELGISKSHAYKVIHKHCLLLVCLHYYI